MKLSSQGETTATTASNSRLSMFKCTRDIFAVIFTATLLLLCMSYTRIRNNEQLYVGSFVKARLLGDECPQAEVLIPQKNNEYWNAANSLISTNEFKQKAIDWLGGAIRIKTESYDNMGLVGEDTRWEVFGTFHEYLLDAFPLVHANLNLTKVNTYGLLYEWPGSNGSLKPILLAGHQDVVPVEPSADKDWKYPPYSGFYDGERLWGRGSSDDKCGVIGALAIIESLLEMKFKPTRTVITAFGFDEELGGYEGAAHLSSTVLDKYGENGVAFMVDEGGRYVEEYGTLVATPGIAEKGSMNVRVTVNMPGGHASDPPAHTGIGILSAMLVHYEDHPYDVYLNRSDPLYTTLQCLAEYTKDMPEGFRQLVRESAYSQPALDTLQPLVSANPLYESIIGTTQAITLIQGGFKSNALPEEAWAVVNHRVSVSSSIESVQQHDTNLLQELAEKFNLTYKAFGVYVTQEGTPSQGNLTIDNAFHVGLSPAPITPTGPDASPYMVFAGSIKAAYHAHRPSENSSLPVAPGMMTGNSDTRYYWKITPYIFRYNHRKAQDNNNVLAGIHTVNESIVVDTFLEMIRFFLSVILNADESNII
ncbi:hypothetical protein BDQ17DRAFT_1420214 [Cyathus striatus]|nr:hypothetical protein BDQ17DRAFT_1420214 [Cyathus striatus]